MTEYLPQNYQNNVPPSIPRRFSRGIVVSIVVVLVVGVAAVVYFFVMKRGISRTPNVLPPQPPLQFIEQPVRPVPRSADLDGDGLLADEEKKFGTDQSKQDTDGDGFYDGEEVKAFKTNPLKKDTDGDGFSDSQEVRAGTNPLDPKSHP